MDDQDYRTIYLMNTYSRVYDAASAWHNDNKKMTPEQEKIMLWLIKIGVK